MKGRILTALSAATVSGMLAGCGGGGSGSAPGGEQPGPLAAPPELLSVNVIGAPNIEIANFVLTGTTRISRTVFEYTYTADATNSDTVAVALTANVASSAISTTVMDGVLDFGNLAAGATKTSLDTFTIRQDRTVAFDENALTWTAETTRASAAGLLLEEVMYAPAAGQVPFIDLINAGTDSVPLQSLLLKVSGVPIRLEDAATELTPGARLHILLDGESRADGLTYHAAPEIVIASTDAGTIALLDKFGEPIDQVAWGTAAGAVNEAGSGVMLDTVTLGSSIGRAPGAVDPQDPDSWVGYSPAEVTPGAPNPYPVVRGLHPLSGAILARAGALVSWFPVPSAVRYRVQVATDPGFSSLLIDTEVEDPHVDVSTLAAGSYVWRVQSQFADNAAAAFSEAFTIELTEGTSVLAALASARVRIQSATAGTGKPMSHLAPKLLPVPLIDQRKDTGMLLLEESHPSDDPFSRPQPPHAWDPTLTHLWNADHGKLEEQDPADKTNCLLASLAMMNHYFGGDLSQDRIGYEVHQGDANGPEWDLNVALIPSSKVAVAYQYALGRVAPTWQAPGDKETLWTLATNLIDVDIPVLAIRASSPAHAFVIVGYDIIGTQRYLVVNDPWHAQQIVYPVGNPGAPSPVDSWAYAAESGSFNGVRQEAGVTADSDGDGVVDFDETERFLTDPNFADSDFDGVRDYFDIYASVFEPKDKKGHHYQVMNDRDYDGDGSAMEVDQDSDSGGCEDGQEDKDGNGKYLGSGTTETWNFDPNDDAGCIGLAGHLQLVVHDTHWDDTHTVLSSLDDTTNISVRLDPDPDNRGQYIDAGSTFSFRGAHQATYVLPQCDAHGNSWGSQSGFFTDPSTGIISASTVPDGSGRISVDATRGIDGENTEGWVSGCGVTAGGSPSGDGFGAAFPAECWGDPVNGAPPGQQTYSFNCHNSVYDATGSLTVVVPPPP